MQEKYGKSMRGTRDINAQLPAIGAWYQPGARVSARHIS
jgi:hypothetical protein